LAAAPFQPAACYQSTSCRAASDLACYGLAFFTDDCKAWRDYAPGDETYTNVSKPPTPAPPAVDTRGTPQSNPTYGQVIVNGEPVGTPEQAQILLNQQIDAQAAAWRAAQTKDLTDAAAGACALMKEDCGVFQSPNASCTACEFDPSKPLFLVAAFAVMGLVLAFRK
jgi:hypothetical protein